MSKMKTKRVQWDQVNMDSALYEVIHNNMSENKASKIYGVPRQTLRRHLAIARIGTMTKPNTYTGRKSVLNPVQEKHFIEILQDMENKLFSSLSALQLRSYVYEYCEHYAINHQFKNDIRMAGKDWLTGFLNRNPNLFLKDPKLNCIDFTCEKLRIFYQTLKSLVYSDNRDIDQRIPADHIYSGSEIPFKTSEDKTVTVFCCASASGCFIPPMFVFPMHVIVPNLLNNAPTSSIGFGNISGQMSHDAYEYWFDHFLEKVQPKFRNYPTILILNSLNAYIRNFKVMLKANDNNVIFLSVPQNCSHKLQPLEISFISNIQKCYDMAVSRWLKQNPERLVSENDISELFCKAYEIGATLESVYLGYRQTGIHPFNPDILLSNENLIQPADFESEVKYLQNSNIIEQPPVPVLEPICHLEN